MLSAYLPLFLFVIVSTISPGGATTLATASGAHFGYRRSLPLLSGIAMGLATIAALSAAGLGSILLAFPALQLAMKLAGSLYLLWLAWKIARSGSPKQAKVSQPTRFWGALLLIWYNPKAWAMSLGASASFSDVAADPWHLTLLLGAFFGVAAILSLSLWCSVGIVLARLLKTTTQWHLLNGFLSLLLVLSIVPMWLS